MTQTSEATRSQELVRLLQGFQGKSTMILEDSNVVHLGPQAYGAIM